VIHLKEEYNKLLDIRFSTHENWHSVQQEKVLPIFRQEIMEFLDALSKKLQTSSDIRNYPDLATFAFYCRKANLNKLCKDYPVLVKSQLGRGITFHIAPSNVPMNFAYSLLMGMLAGNINIVRIPSKNYAQIEVFLNALTSLQKEKIYKDALAKVILVQYERNKELTDFFSSICANRVIWGGDTTIAEIRKSPLPARSYDIAFSDRYSICILGIESILDLDDMNNLANWFFNDTYLFDQNACTSPHTIIWSGNRDKLSQAQDRFWNAVSKLLHTKQYQLQAATAVDKLTYAYEQIMDNKIVELKTHENLIYRANLAYLKGEVFDSHSNCGYFNELFLEDLQELAVFLDSPKFQTISYFGVHPVDIETLILDNGLKGVDRIVPVGKTADFSATWDGFDLIQNLSRNLTVN
jgi:hypothetical protein